jgi:hypothetical protein
MSDTTLEHCWVHISSRKVVMLDSEGYQEEIQWKFDEDGTEGFSDTIQHIRAMVPEEDFCFVL